MNKEEHHITREEGSEVIDTKGLVPKVEPKTKKEEHHSTRKEGSEAIDTKAMYFFSNLFSSRDCAQDEEGDKDITIEKGSEAIDTKATYFFPNRECAKDEERRTPQHQEGRI
ncbi:unnamed protein product [Nezara viridula]|uniref:Uncharacterized protein n=1 Tax=Nezara viridula TaxID=85310 RepID=A0A9P0EAY1_NEZVI|nr:unnamed protein product [Nezara viridula]